MLLLCPSSPPPMETRHFPFASSLSSWFATTGKRGMFHITELLEKAPMRDELIFGLAKFITRWFRLYLTVTGQSLQHRWCRATFSQVGLQEGSSTGRCLLSVVGDTWDAIHVGNWPLPCPPSSVLPTVIRSPYPGIQMGLFWLNLEPTPCTAEAQQWDFGLFTWFNVAEY